MQGDQIDWIRFAHRVLSFMRGLRGDAALADEDHALERARGSKLTATVEDFARRQVDGAAKETNEP